MNNEIQVITSPKINMMSNFNSQKTYKKSKEDYKELIK